MLTVTFTQGISGSGKTTWAKSVLFQVENTVIVCKDDIRNMLWNGMYSKERESLVKAVRNAIIIQALKHGKNVIVADTNFDNHISEVKAIVEPLYPNVTFKVKSFLDVPLDVCIDRDANRTNSLGEEILRQQYNRWVKSIESVTTPEMTTQVSLTKLKSEVK